MKTESLISLAAPVSGSVALHQPGFVDDAAAPSSFKLAYREISDRGHIVETNVLEQLKQNMARLEDLHGRLRYIMTEISGLVRR